MSVSDACKEAIARLVGRRYASVFSNDDEICVEISSLANEAADDIAKAHPWQRMLAVHTIDGDSVTDAWPLPANYDRMVNGTDIMSGTWHDRHYEYAGTLDNWMNLQSLRPALPPGYWIIIDDRINFLPRIETGDNAKFYYVKSNYATDAGGTPKPKFDNDADLFILNNRVLTLALIWRWKAMKVMEYGEDIRLYDEALSQEMSRDQGSRVIRSGYPRRHGAFSTAYPWTLGGI